MSLQEDLHKFTHDYKNITSEGRGQPDFASSDRERWSVLERYEKEKIAALAAVTKKSISDTNDLKYNIPVTITEEQLSIFEDLRRHEQLSTFQNMVWVQFCKRQDPSQIKYMRTLVPEIFERKWMLIDLITTIQRKAAHLFLFGPQTKEDLHYLFWLKKIGLSDEWL